MTDYSLFGNTVPGPPSVVPYSGAYGAGVLFSVTSGGKWLKAYRWWVAASGQDTAAGQRFALWQVNSQGLPPKLVPGSVVTAGPLVPGWNVIPLPSPLLLTPGAQQAYGAVYCAVTAKTFTAGFPEAKNQFGAGQPYAAGIASGPLTGYSSTGGSLPAGGGQAWGKPQQPYMLAADPTAAMPAVNDSDAFLGMDVLVTDTAPGAQSYRGFPNSPLFVVQGVSAQASAYTIGLHFTLSRPCRLTRIWHYSPPGSTALPSRCAIWDGGTQAVVSGTDNQSPAWSGAAASGWVSCDYGASGAILQAGKEYIASVFTADGTSPWFLAQASFWGGSPGPFSAGIDQGPLTLLGNAAAHPGQDSWAQSPVWQWPGTSTNPEFDGLDVEVTSVASSGTGLLVSAGLA